MGKQFEVEGAGYPIFTRPCERTGDSGTERSRLMWKKDGMTLEVDAKLIEGALVGSKLVGA